MALLPFLFLGQPGTVGDKRNVRSGCGPNSEGAAKPSLPAQPRAKAGGSGPAQEFARVNPSVRLPKLEPRPSPLTLFARSELEAGREGCPLG